MRAEVMAKTWVNDFPRPDPASNARHASAVKPFGRHFGRAIVQNISATDARRFAEKYPGAYRYVLTMLNDYEAEGKIRHHHFAGLRLPKKVNGKRRLSVPTPEEVDALIAHGGQLATAIEVAAYTGIRRSESRGLAVCDRVTGRFDRLEICRQLTRDDRFKEPKTGERRIYVPERAQKALSRAASSARTGAALELLWRVSDRHWTRLWDETRELTGLRFRWHDLRHFAATWYLDAGATVQDVSVQLGCSVAEIERTYGHPDPELALERLQGLVP